MFLTTSPPLDDIFCSNLHCWKMENWKWMSLTFQLSFWYLALPTKHFPSIGRFEIFAWGNITAGKIWMCWLTHALKYLPSSDSRHATPKWRPKDVLCVENPSSNLTIVGVIPIWFCIWSMSSDYEAMIEHRMACAHFAATVIALNRCFFYDSLCWLDAFPLTKVLAIKLW